jgi:hypothetical protein
LSKLTSLINQGEFIPSAWVNRSCIFNRPFGQVGDEINVLMATCAWNLRKWLVIATIFLFWQKLILSVFLGVIIISRPLKTHPKQTKTTHFANHPNQQNCFLCESKYNQT